MRRSRKAKTKERRDVFYRQKTSQNTSKKSPPDLAADHGGDGGDGRFYGCYLLTSLSPRYKGHTYIGFTVNPKRRIRQHNGEITSGASSTKKKRPWEMILCIHGFPTNVAALQFEWAWQHPKESIAVRETAASFKTLGGIANKIKLALTMLTLPSWNSLDLTVSFFSTSYMKHTAGCPTLPRQMKLHFSSLDELPCYSDPLCPPASDHDDDDDNDDDDDDDNLHSYLNPDTVDVFDHLNGPPVFGSTETDPSSVNSLSYTHQTTPENFSSYQAIGGPSDEDSFYMISNPRPDEHSSPHKFPADVGGSGDDYLWPSLGDSVSPFGSHTFSSTLLPILKKHNLNDYTKPSKEDPSRRPDRSVMEQPSKVDFVSIPEKAVRNDDFTYVLIGESPEEKRQRTGKYLMPQSPADIVGPSSTKIIEPIEVIDLYTPSPDCRIVAVSKKSRISGDCSNFIDLTRSPLFLEL